MCTVLLAPGVNPIAVNKCVKLQEGKDVQFTDEVALERLFFICKTAVCSVPDILTEWQYLLLAKPAEYIPPSVSPDNGNTPTHVSIMQCSEY